MRADRKTGKNRIARLIQAGLVASATMLSAGYAVAQSAYDCHVLETFAPLPSVEGEGGTFFAIRPELQAHHGLGDDTITLISNLKAALDAGGTTLVVLPVPTRAQVLSHQLPETADHLGYDVDLSRAVHVDMIRRLKAAGLTVADPLPALRTSALRGVRPFFETDPRPTTVGTRVLAQSVGAALADHPALVDVVRMPFRSTEGNDVTLTSAMRTLLQTACQSELPAVTTQSFVTSKNGVGTTSSSTDLVATRENLLVVLGSDITATPELNLEGFISEATGLDARSYGVPDGGAFAAMSSYITSAGFQASPPLVLVWEVPVSASMAIHGDQPLRELVVAAGNTCRGDIAVTSPPSGGRLRADLDHLPAGADIMLALDVGVADVSFVRFHFTGADGLIRTRSIYRHPNQHLTGRFYIPLSGLNANGLRSVEIEGPVAFGPQSRLTACI